MHDECSDRDLRCELDFRDSRAPHRMTLKPAYLIFLGKITSCLYCILPHESRILFLGRVSVPPAYSLLFVAYSGA